jgi:hypothetical protein
LLGSIPLVGKATKALQPTVQLFLSALLTCASLFLSPILAMPLFTPRPVVDLRLRDLLGLAEDVAELVFKRIAVRGRLTGAVLFPEKGASDVGAAQLGVHVGPVRHGPQRLRILRRARKQQALEARVSQFLRKRPGYAGGAGTAQVHADGPLAEAQGGGDLAVAQAVLKGEAKKIPYPAHRQSLGRHGVPSLQTARQSVARLDCRSRLAHPVSRAPTMA